MMSYRDRCMAPAEQVLEIDSNDFPLESRMAIYALAFLELGQLGRVLLRIIFSVLSPEDSWSLVNGFRDEAKFKDLKESLDEAEDAADWGRAFTVLLGAPSCKLARRFVKQVRPLLRRMVVKDRASYRRRTDQLCRKLNLIEEEVQLLELGCCYTLNKGLERMIDSFNTTKKIGLFSLLTGIPHSQVSRLISSKGKLIRNDLLSLERMNLEVDNVVYDYLIGNAGRDFASDAFKTVKRAKLAFSDFDLAPVQMRTLAGIIGSSAPAHLLFYGKPGTGKTELAKTLACQCGIEAVVVSFGSDGDARERKTALLSTVNSVPVDTLVIVDEVDGLLNTQSLFRTATVNKGWINQFMDANRHKMIWIINESNAIEESVRRRFSYSLPFKTLTWRQRSAVWHRVLIKQRMKRFFSEAKIHALSKRYPVSPGLIAYAVKTVNQSRTAEMPAETVHAILNEVLTRQMVLTEGRKPEQKLNALSPSYDPSALNTDSDTARLCDALKAYGDSDVDYGLNLLFWGWPGTGKTEFAKYLSEQLGKELLVKRMSDLQSKYVGETEQNIAAAFRSAAENDAILFLDEADSLFINRQTAQRSWESSQTNEILTQMENFPGILICCTNLLEYLDEAAMRRFSFKIKFNPLTEEGKLRLYSRYFSDIKGDLAATQKKQLATVQNLCPGDIKAVWQRLRFMGNQLTHPEVISELQKEVSYKPGQTKAALGF